MNREIMGDLLGEDYEVSYASDGEEALETLRSHKGDIDLVLLDLLMPNKYGREVLAEMQLDEDLMSIPVVVCPRQDDYEQLIEEFTSEVLAEEELAGKASMRFGVFSDAQQEADIEERFVRAKIAADRVKDDPEVICGYYDLG